MLTSLMATQSPLSMPVTLKTCTNEGAGILHEARAETKLVWAMPCKKEEDEVN